MATNPVDTLLALTGIIENLDMRQDILNQRRLLHARNQLMQLHLDRTQASLDEKREWVRHMMLSISSRN